MKIELKFNQAFLLINALLFCYCADLHAYICSKKLQQKLATPFEEWKNEQITLDLQPYNDKNCSKGKVFSNFLELSTKFPNMLLVHYSIANNKVTYRCNQHVSHHPRVAQFINFLNNLFLFFKIPNIEFIVCHEDSYDIPEVLKNTFVPIFVFSKKKDNQKAILFPDIEYVPTRNNILSAIDAICLSSPWQSKNSIAFWRGSTTGIGYETGENIRLKLVEYSQKSLLVDAAFTNIYLSGSIRNEIISKYPPKPAANLETQIAYKYLIAVEGNSFPSSLFWQLASNSCVLLGESDYIEWYYRGLIPFKHYVPFKRDCSDLNENIIWLIEHDPIAKSIAVEGSKFAKEHLSIEDVAIYFYQLFLAYDNLFKKRFDEIWK